MAVASAEAAAEIKATASEVCPSRTVAVLVASEWLNFTVWAEDAFVVGTDTSEGSRFIIEPKSFGRAGDDHLAEELFRGGGPRIESVPLAFQGGNILVGNDFVLVGRDYLDESISTARAAVRGFPESGAVDEEEAFVAALFRRFLDHERDFHFLTSEPKERGDDGVFDFEGEPWLHTISAGRGKRQPIFHIDMFVTLVGSSARAGPYRVLVGDPGEADRLLGWSTVDHNLQNEFDEIAAQLAEAGFEVIRTPLPYMPVWIRASEPYKVDDTPVVGEVVWYHATTNNCLVQITTSSREVWVPTYGHPPFPELSAVDEWYTDLWETLGFTVHQLGDFHTFAQAMGALHCIKKYLSRGPG